METVVVDTSRIIEKLRDDTLEEYFKDHLRQNNRLLIDPFVHAELDSDILLEREQKIKLQKLIQEHTDDGLIIDSMHRYKLKKDFKELYQDLKHSRAGIDTTDRHLIALSIQEGAYLDTIDEGIIKALKILKFSNNRWRQFMTK